MSTHDELGLRQAEVADFRRRWFRFARRWRAASRRDTDEARTLVATALAEGLPPIVDGDPAPPPDAVQGACARAVVAASGFMDADEYALQHRLRRGTDPVRHFVDEGWRSLRTPSLRFDLWSYWAEHLDPTDDTVNPLLHFLLRGRHDGLSPVPTPTETRQPTTLAGKPRRACLFAGHDRDGLVDDTVVAYLTELSRHADVFYLADGVLGPGQLDRLAGVTAGARSVPHGAYDFGSFSLLARELVGWERLAPYDEVVLANDSCYLLRPLDDVFAEMDTRACDWWSLQATSMEHDESYISDDSPIPLAEAKRRFIGPRHWTDDRFVHLSSYFLAFRRPVLDDPGFRFRPGHGGATGGEAARHPQVRGRHQPLPPRRRLRLRHLPARPVGLPPALRAPLLRARRAGLPAGQAQLPRREPAPRRRPGAVGGAAATARARRAVHGDALPPRARHVARHAARGVRRTPGRRRTPADPGAGDPGLWPEAARSRDAELRPLVGLPGVGLRADGPRHARGPRGGPRRPEPAQGGAHPGPPPRRR
ncbi:rhamnan synthesis F family protein [Nocardioides sp. B-3]|uniref:rhamnan synthesis F family protein n=1 Tax=Nocardioides sp. B-3 TaxID=2895565 RepID=UPI00215393DF|nr:rhamnan synthesis F family protein [Nocardioides sp. B-3]UUZ60021.1 rhamnan synthesis F family protein [Nocardioides sp. B-3]